MGKAATNQSSTLNVTDHILLPKHVKLGEKEKKALLENYSITIRELPKISIHDPALRGMELKAGDVLKVIRKSHTAGTAVFYRGVVNA